MESHLASPHTTRARRLCFGATLVHFALGSVILILVPLSGGELLNTDAFTPGFSLADRLIIFSASNPCLFYWPLLALDVLAMRLQRSPNASWHSRLFRFYVATAILIAAIHITMQATAYSIGTFLNTQDRLTIVYGDNPSYLVGVLRATTLCLIPLLLTLFVLRGSRGALPADPRPSHA